jgi:NitT/TauT family transport system permease protein
MFAGLGVIAAMGIATYAIFALLEQRFTGWATRRQDVQVGGGG